MRQITILEPIWKTRSVGIADYKITDDIEVEITYKDRNRERVYPGKYYMTKAKALTYPTSFVHGSVRLRIIPIADFTCKTINKLQPASEPEGGAVPQKIKLITGEEVIVDKNQLSLW